MLSTSSHVFSEIFIHLNWHCLNDRPLIDSRLEEPLYKFLQDYSDKCKGIKFEGLNGTQNHIHLVIQMEPFICLADWVGKVKGASSHEMNKKTGLIALQWQRGYGAVSFAKRDLPAVQKYVRGQKDHHQIGKINTTLELYGTFMENEAETVGEEESNYA